MAGDLQSRAINVRHALYAGWLEREPAGRLDRDALARAFTDFLVDARLLAWCEQLDFGDIDREASARFADTMAHHRRVWAPYLPGGPR